MKKKIQNFLKKLPRITVYMLLTRSLMNITELHSSANCKHSNKHFDNELVLITLSLTSNILFGIMSKLVSLHLTGPEK